MSDTLKLRMDVIGRAGVFEPALLERFGEWVETAPDESLYRVPVLKWAAEHEVEERIAIDLFLHAAKAGIFEMSWGIICPTCGLLIQTPGGLRAIQPDPHCGVCQVDFQATMDDQFEVSFTLEPGIRKLRFLDHTLMDFGADAFRIYFSPSLEYGEWQRAVIDAVKAHVVLGPGESGSIEVEVVPGIGKIISAPVHAVAGAELVEGGPLEATLEILDGQMVPTNLTLGTGTVKLEVKNRTDYEVPFAFHAFQDYDEHELPPPPKMLPFLTGKRVMTNQTFRTLFRAEAVGEDGLRIKNLSILFTDLRASTALYERVGDLKALALVREHFDRLQEVVALHEGAIVKTIGDAIMAAFAEPERAMAAAADMTRAVQNIQTDEGALGLKVGIHAGSCVAVQTNSQLDYFGRAVNIAARVQGEAGGGEIVVTDTIWEAPGVKGIAEGLGLTAKDERVCLKGIVDEMPIHRLS